MHCDIHHRTHTYRATELHREATTLRPPHTSLRSRVGWTMVELGLRLAESRPARAAVRAPRPA
ncbi:hypothetical protein [Streptomyces sp. BE147]|uniref:hypothetical protein n=1 Tax=unclassified Streptomyces TaxID=2593676 RepID=UPI002E77BFF6|nr:hypothetical protein [Streptomyces sp. BE147]MEE1739475.1 hypothetical protein [Streptomyces sp. BE147]